MTGGNTITDINFITVLNWLEIEKDIKDQEIKAEKQMMQQVRR